MSKRHPRLAAFQRTGNVAVLVAVMLPTVLIPLLAIGVDGGMLMEDRRRLQSAADAAALSAVVQLYRDNPTHTNAKVQLAATSAALSAAREALDLHGFSSAKCQTRTVNIPATSTNQRIHNMPGTVEVVVTYLQGRGFSRLWGTADLPVTARAVARVKNISQGNGIILLEDADDQALYGHGGGKLIVNEAGVAVNSAGPSAAQTDGESAVLAATSFDVTGDYTGGGYYGTPYPAEGHLEPYTNSVPVPDPLRDLPEPNPADYPVKTARNGGPEENITLEPGRYTRQILFSGNRTITLLPGIYYLEKGITIEGDVNVVGAGVMIFNAGSGVNDNINLQGTGTWALTPPTSGTYAGIAIFQSRQTTENLTNIIRGNGGSGITGTIYTPTTKTLITGSGTQVLGSQFISRTLEMSGSGNFIVNYPAAKAPQPPVIELVE